MNIRRTSLLLAGVATLAVSATAAFADGDHQMMRENREPRYSYLGNSSLGDFRWRPTPSPSAIGNNPYGPAYDYVSGNFSGPGSAPDQYPGEQAHFRGQYNYYIGPRNWGSFFRTKVPTDYSGKGPSANMLR
jgi:hypothetical protein